MRIIGILLSFVLSNTLLTAQNLEGTVLDKSTQKPIAGVHIIINNSTVGCTSDLNGHFEINTGNGDTLLVSHVGYQSMRFVPDTKKAAMVIYLEQAPVMLHSIQVSVTKNSLPVSLQQASISYLSEKNIRVNISRSMAEAMSTTAGVWLQKTNHGGGSPFIRGLTGNYTLLLVDGIRLNNSTFRYGPNQYFNTISPFTVNAVEVLRGAGSTLYGSDAIGGTININTISPSFEKDKKIYGSVGGQFMSHGMEYTGNVELGGNLKKFAYILNGSIREFGDLQAGGDLGYERPSGYSEKDFLFKGLLRISENRKLTLNYQWLRQDSVPRYDQVAQKDYKYYNFTLQQRQLAYARFEQEWFDSPFKNFQLTASFQQSNEERDTRKNDSPINKNERDDVSTLGLNASLNVVLFKKIESVFGGDFYYDWIGSTRKLENVETGQDTVFSRGLYPDGSSSFTTAFYNSNLYTIKRWTFQLGWRYNYTSNTAEDAMFGDLGLASSSLIGNGSISYKFNNNNLYVTVNSGFRVPNINDISSLGDFDYGVEVPPANLKPEKSTNYELGYKLAVNSFSLNVAGFYSRIADLIDRIPATYHGDSLINGSRVYTKANVGEAYVTGIETDFEVGIVSNFSIIGNITYTYGQNVTKDEPFRRIPPLFGGLSLRYDKTAYYVTLQGLAAGKQDRLSGGDIDDHRIPDGGTPGWFVINLKGGYQWKWIGVKLAFNNILNEPYRMHGSGVDGIGRHVAGSVRFFF